MYLLMSTTREVDCSITSVLSIKLASVPLPEEQLASHRANGLSSPAPPLITEGLLFLLLLLPVVVVVGRELRAAAEPRGRPGFFQDRRARSRPTTGDAVQARPLAARRRPPAPSAGGAQRAQRPPAQRYAGAAARELK